MLQRLVKARSYGSGRANCLKRVVTSQRLADLELSPEIDLGRHHAKAVTSIDFENSTGRYLLSGAVDGSILIYDVQYYPDGSHIECPVVAKAKFGSNQEPGRNPFHFASSSENKHSISAISWYPHDTGIFLSSSTDETLKVWDTNAMCVAEEFELDDIIYHHTMPTSSSHFLVAAGDRNGVITLCDIKSGSAIHVLRHHKQSVFALSWSPSSDFILASAGRDNTILLWDIRKVGGPLVSLDQHNGAGVASTSNILTAHNGAVNGLCFTNEGRWIISYGTDHRLRLWDALNGRNMLINYGRVSNWFSGHCQLAVTTCGHTSRGGGFVYVPSGHDIVVLDLMSGKKLGMLEGHFRNVNCCSLHPYEQVCRDYLLPTGYCLEPEWVVASIINSNEGNELWKISAFVLHLGYILFSGGSDCKLLAWTPKRPVVKAIHTVRSTTHRSAPINAYHDSWSDDENEA